MDRREEMKRARQARPAHVLAWRGSGMTQAAYCRQHHLNATTFNGWLRDARADDPRDAQLGASQRKEAPLTALAVIVSPDAPALRSTITDTTPRERAALTVTGAGGWQISIDSDSSTASTRKTLAALLVEIDHASTHANLTPRQ